MLACEGFTPSWECGGRFKANAGLSVIDTFSLVISNAGDEKSTELLKNSSEKKMCSRKRKGRKKKTKNKKQKSKQKQAKQERQYQSRDSPFKNTEII